MILDALLVAWDNVAVTVTAFSNAIDLTTTADISRGDPMRARLQVDTTFTAGGAATGTWDLIQSANSDLSSPDVLYTTGAIAVAATTAGTVLIDTAIPATSKRYVGFRCTLATGPFTAGKVTGALVHDTDTPLASRLVGNTGR